MMRTYQEQLDHLNVMVGKLHEHKNIAIGRIRKPVILDRWLDRARKLLDEADDEEVYTIQIEEENMLPDNPTEEDLFNCYIEILNRSAQLLADKKQVLSALGSNPILTDGRLSIEEYFWLQPIKKNKQVLIDELEKVRTAPQQMKNASEEAIY